MRTPSRRAFLAPILALGTAAFLSGPAAGTWSIVLVDRSTGEVAIGCATCLEGLDLEVYVPVMLTGIGGACAQSSIDSNGRNRQLIWDEMQLGTAPISILNKLSNRDGQHQTRQYGIVDMQLRRQTFTGTQCGQFAGGVAGFSGGIAYAIQGNVITGMPVVSAAEAAIIGTTGDLAEKLMAGMEAAHAQGGDGRCSCDPGDADRCGSPPPGFDPDVDKSAHIGFMMLSRIGDIDGVCNSTVGCGTGDYYMDLNISFQDRNDPDPVIQLREEFDAWRDSWRGRPDHLLTTKSLAADSLPGNGTAQTTLTIVATDWEGNAVGHGGAAVTVGHASGSAGLASFGTPVDHGDGTYSVPVTTGIGQGIDLLQVALDDGLGPVTLYPFPALTHTNTLTSDLTTISAAAGGTVNFGIFGPEEPQQHQYLLLCTASGTTPGMVFPSVVVPLNFDAVVLVSYAMRNTSTFVNTDATLFPDGTSSAQFVALPGELDPLVGFELDFAYFTNSPVMFASNFVPLVIDP